jgi:leucyl-tRNA synthetase
MDGKPSGRMGAEPRGSGLPDRQAVAARDRHATIKKVGEDIEALSFNTAIAQMMICT